MRLIAKRKAATVFIILFFCFAGAVCYFAYRDGGNPGGKVSEEQGKISRVCVSGNCFAVELALTSEDQARGLMYRKSMDADRGMLFVFAASGTHKFWMKNTLIPLDIVWIGQDFKIIHIAEQTPPCSSASCPDYGPEEAAKYVLEVNGGQMSQIGAKVGDVVAITE